jgi:hypothetical protein
MSILLEIEVFVLATVIGPPPLLVTVAWTVEPL